MIDPEKVSNVQKDKRPGRNGWKLICWHDTLPYMPS